MQREKTLFGGISLEKKIRGELRKLNPIREKRMSGHANSAVSCLMDTTVVREIVKSGRLWSFEVQRTRGDPPVGSQRLEQQFICRYSYSRGNLRTCT